MFVKYFMPEKESSTLIRKMIDFQIPELLEGTIWRHFRVTQNYLFSVAKYYSQPRNDA